MTTIVQEALAKTSQGQNFVLSEIDQEIGDTLLLLRKRERQQKRTPSPTQRHQAVVGSTASLSSTQAACVSSVSHAVFAAQRTESSVTSKDQGSNLSVGNTISVSCGAVSSH